MLRILVVTSQRISQNSFMPKLRRFTLERERGRLACCFRRPAENVVARQLPPCSATFLSPEPVGQTPTGAAETVALPFFRDIAILLACFVFIGKAAPLRGQVPATENVSGNASFSKDIAPIFLKKCQACHGLDKSKGEFQLHTIAALMKGGKSKSPAVAPGKPTESEIFKRITTSDADDRMPQKDDRLSDEQIALIERWIKQGARFDSADTNATLASLVPREPNPNPPEVYPRPVPVTALAFSPDGKEMAVGGYHEITIWNAADGKLLRRIKDIAQQTLSLAYHPDGTLLAAASGTPGKVGEVKLFDPIQGTLTKTLATTPDVMCTVSFNPDGNQLAAGGADNAIRLFDVATTRQTLLIEQHADWVMALTFSPDGQRVASASRDKSARVFDSKTGEMLSSYLGHSEVIMGVAFTSDGKTVCTAGRDKKIHVWTVAEAKKTTEIGGFDAEVFRVVIHRNSVFSCSADKLVRQHSITDGKLIRIFAGHTDWVYSIAVDKEGKRLAAGSFDGEVRIWNIDDGELLVAFVAAPGRMIAAKKD
ncbi:MAG TPA: c-type cytochrome domain-containing protein [Candidatus Eisenbacteria bacterium]|nr:c-type cytochrome domain-containing protein [Candidatus Eisenbacteria bacterium]